MSKRDYYEVLGVSREASDGELKKAFRGLARELHPDVNAHDPAAEEKFKEAAEAYEVLSDPERRSTYDSYGHDGLRSGGWAPNQGFSFQDIFDQVFGGGDPFGFGRRGPAPGGDVGVVVRIGLEDVLTGVNREVAFEAVAACEHCRGNGAEPGTPIRTCERCEGTGQLRRVSRSILGQVVQASPCDRCGGEGSTAETPCAECSGRGRVAGERTWEVDIPPGIEDGQRIRVSGAGHAGDAGAQPGDLYVEVEVEMDPSFQREGTELVTTVEIPATAAMLGTEVMVPTLEGEHELKIPAGTQPGDVIELDKRGLPPLRGGRRGKLHVLIKVTVPGKLDKRQRALAEELDQSLNGAVAGARSRR